MKVERELCDKKTSPYDHSNPFIHLDLNRTIFGDFKAFFAKIVTLLQNIRDRLLSRRKSL